MKEVIQKTITFPTETKYLEELRHFVADVLAETSMSQRQRALLVLALDECVSSIIDYAEDVGYHSDITVTVDLDDVRFKAVVADSRTTFDTIKGKATQRGSTRFSKERRHKLRIFLLQSIVDEIHYSYQKGFENRLELLKFL